MIDKLEKDGRVAVLVSSGFGAGWSTWCKSENSERAAFDPVLAEAVLSNSSTAELKAIADERFPGEYQGGISDGLEVEWLDKGTPFYVHEYDGSEHIVSPKDLIYTA